MIDLHTHVLAGIDDGPSDLSGSIALAAAAARQGVTALVATPHVRDDYPTSPESMADALARVRTAVRDAGIALEVLPGAEIAFDWLPRLSDRDLHAFALGGDTGYLLVEVPFFGWPLDAEMQVQRLGAAGFRTVLAHPERSVVVQRDPRRILPLVRGGALVQITAGSLVGSFGPPSRRAAQQLISSHLTHVIASDSHADDARVAELAPALDSIGDPALRHWLSTDVPAAIVAGRPCPPRPASGRWRRLSARRRGPN